MLAALHALYAGRAITESWEGGLYLDGHPQPPFTRATMRALERRALVTYEGYVGWRLTEHGYRVTADNPLPPEPDR